jgi:chaperonin cofactor prefoldin
MSKAGSAVYAEQLDWLMPEKLMEGRSNQRLVQSTKPMLDNNSADLIENLQHQIHILRTEVIHSNNRCEELQDECDNLRGLNIGLQTEIEDIRNQNKDLTFEVCRLRTMIQQEIKKFSNSHLVPVIMKQKVQNVHVLVEHTICQSDGLQQKANYESILASVRSWKRVVLPRLKESYVVEYCGVLEKGVPQGKGNIHYDKKVFEGEFRLVESEDGAFLECKDDNAKIYYQNGDVFIGTIKSSKLLFSRHRGTTWNNQDTRRKVVQGEWDSNDEFKQDSSKHGAYSEVE